MDILVAILVIAVILFCGWLLFLWFRLVWRALDFLPGAIRKATTPIPGPPEIAVTLAREWGREPTVQEVQAVHQLLHTERNQALVASGLSLGGAYLLLRG